MFFFFNKVPDVSIELLLNKKQHVTKENILRLLEIIIQTLHQTTDWSPDKLLESFRRDAEKNNVKLGQLLWPLRAILTGKPFSPGATEVASALGQEETMERLKKVQQTVT